MTRINKRRLERLESSQSGPDGGPRLIILTAPPDDIEPELMGYRVGGKDWLASDGEAPDQLAKRILKAIGGSSIAIEIRKEATK